MKRNILIVGGTRGLGASLVKEYLSHGDTVYATCRTDDIYELDSDSDSGAECNSKFVTDVSWITGVDVTNPGAGSKIAYAIEGDQLDIVIISAGYFGTESFQEPNWDDEVKMYTTSSIAPVFIVKALVNAGVFIDQRAKIILVSSESGSITLRHESEGGGNYGHHASKAALNMVGKLLSLDLKAIEIAVGIVHPGFMRTEMTKGVGFDKFWDEGGAVTPDEAAKSLVRFIETFHLGMTGQYWAPRGPR